MSSRAMGLAAELAARLNCAEYKNWVRAGQALLLLRGVLQPFATAQLRAFHARLAARLPRAARPRCACAPRARQVPPRRGVGGGAGGQPSSSRWGCGGAEQAGSRAGTANRAGSRGQSNRSGGKQIGGWGGEQKEQQVGQGPEQRSVRAGADLWHTWQKGEGGALY